MRSQNTRPATEQASPTAVSLSSGSTSYTELALRDYQQRNFNLISQYFNEGPNRVLLVEPCGAGKGFLAAHMIKLAVRAGRRVMFLVNRKGLVMDMSERLDALGLDHGIIMGDNPRRKPWLSVHVASIDTLRRREQVPPADFLIIDEAHFCASDGWLEVLAKYPNARVLGLTATPIRMDGRGLGKVFNKMILSLTPQQMIERGFRAPSIVYSPSQPDLSGVDVMARDFNKKQLAAACDQGKLVGDIVEHWLRLGRGRPTVFFGVNRKHAQHVQDLFREAGVRTVYADAHTPVEERKRYWDALEAGDVEIACTVDIISYGWNAPKVSCGIDGRPTMSLAGLLQKWGRIQRIHPTKTYALWLDHAGNVARHGFSDEDREWSLDADRTVKKSDSAPGVRTCSHCWCCFPAYSDRCPACGTAYQVKDREIKTVDGTLEEVRPERWYRCTACQHRGRLPDGAVIHGFACARCQCGPLQALGSKYDPGAEDKRKQKFLTWVQEAKERGYKPKYPEVRYKALYGQWPPSEWLKEVRA